MFSYLQELDKSLFYFINQNLANSIGDWCFPLLNHLAPFAPFLFLLLGWIAYQKSSRLWFIALAVILLVVAGDSFIFNPLKQTVARPRPAASLQAVRILASGATGGYSFPSSHTAIAFTIAVVLSFYFPKKRKLIYALASLIGFARIYVGVHYPSDIIGSALLGWLFGTVCLLLGQQVGKRILPDLKTRLSNVYQPVKLHANFFAVLPWLVLATIQLLRLFWAATTELDVSPGTAYLWSLASSPEAFPKTPWLLHPFSHLWFGLFGSSPLSLWGIPWAFQSLWLGLLAWALRRNLDALWGIVFLAAIIPIESQLSFLGSPQEIFSESDWKTTLIFQTFIFYAILAFPIWIAAFLQFFKHPIATSITLASWGIAVFFPMIPWWIPTFASSGTLIIFADQIGKKLFSFTEARSGWSRLGLIFLVAYGLTVGIAVYNPRFLRKLDISFIPRNNPHYIQTGWREWIHKIHPHIKIGPGQKGIVLTDFATSRNQVHYLLGRSFQVFSPEDILHLRSMSLKGAYYIRETYFTQIHPEMKFQFRNAWLSNGKNRMKKLDHEWIIRKGDPIRQFEFFVIEND